MAIVDAAPQPVPVTAAADRGESLWSKLRYYAASHPLGVVGAIIMIVFVFAAVFAPWLTAYDPIGTDPRVALTPPSPAHIFGADAMGRDIYAPIVYGARI